MGKNSNSNKISYQPDIERYLNKFSIIKHFYIAKPYNPLVNAGAIMSVALILKLVESNDEYEDDMSSKYELVHDCIKVISFLILIE